MRRFRKTVNVEAEMTSGGRLLRSRLGATGNARLPTVDSRVRRITSCMRTTTTGDGRGWNRRRGRCSRRDTRWRQIMQALLKMKLGLWVQCTLVAKILATPMVCLSLC